MCILALSPKLEACHRQLLVSPYSTSTTTTPPQRPVTYTFPSSGWPTPEDCRLHPARRLIRAAALSTHDPTTSHLNHKQRHARVSPGAGAMSPPT